MLFRSKFVLYVVSVGTCLFVVCASALAQTSPAGRWPCARTCCRAISQSGLSWRGMRVKICLEFRWWGCCSFCSCLQFGVEVSCLCEWIFLCTRVRLDIVLRSDSLRQVEGCFPDTMTRCAELINSYTDVDFVDINSGCPIDLVYKKVNFYLTTLSPSN